MFARMIIPIRIVGATGGGECLLFEWMMWLALVERAVYTIPYTLPVWW
jgi:hypothetical protein